MEFEPTTTDLGGSIDWISYKVFLDKVYRKEYARAQFNYAKRFYDYYINPSKILTLPTTIRANVLKSLISISKCKGEYSSFRDKLKQSGIKWLKPDNFTTFLNILNNNHDSLREWYKSTINVLDDSYKTFFRFVLVSGLRKNEALTSFNMIIELSRNGKLGEYYNTELSTLEHFRYPKLFFRNTKNVYISIIPQDLIESISKCHTVSYASIHKKLERARALRVVVRGCQD